MVDIDIDQTNIIEKPLPEGDTRKSFLEFARMRQCEKELIILLDKYDKLLRNCKNLKEREAISKLGCYDVFKLLGIKDGEAYSKFEFSKR